MYAYRLLKLSHTEKERKRKKEGETDRQTDRLTDTETLRANKMN